ncbi:hypothetical protein HF521_009628 [Silurus meridionalis]|uniref:Mediator of RNA polymerase II transcription subunit 6 n=1 Tax=Silurus meridionalis TaxID=175797 RepID=A0A8T0BYK5_SILME|nr:hypothetical protein HF521_009628 [Silurus meridionalis]
MAAVDLRDNLLGISWVDSSWVPMLNSGNVLDYFSERSNPFYDRTCNNEVVKMQRLTLDHLKQMVGVEYILLHAQEPILYIIRKQQRQSPAQLVPIADYYIIAGVVYQAPDLGSVISSRVLSAVHGIQSAFDESISSAQVILLSKRSRGELKKTTGPTRRRSRKSRGGLWEGKVLRWSSLPLAAAGAQVESADMERCFPGPVSEARRGEAKRFCGALTGINGLM